MFSKANEYFIICDFLFGMQYSIRNSLGIFLCLLLLNGCNKRYWFRSKIDDGKSKKYSVKIIINNESPTILSDKFVAVMRHACVKGLKQKGYFEIPIDSPQFQYILTLRVDSFNASAGTFNAKKGIYTTAPQKGLKSFKHTVKAIEFDCQMKHYKKGWMQWQNADDIYYFGEYRDIGRSEGMVRYLIRTAEPKLP